MVKINYKSDFKINERSETVALEVPFVFSYYVFDNKKYVASFDGNTYVNCERKEDGSLDVIFNSPGFGVGRLKVERKYAVDDKAFVDGVYDIVTVDNTDVFITSGKTFETYIETLVVPPYIKGDKGDKGDPMTWSGMTKEEQAELVQEVTASTQEAGLLEKVTGNEKISISDGSGVPKAITTEQIKNYIEESKESSSLEFVDLGLPSGTLWATRNIGAEKPEDSGLFFAWGETEGYNVSYTEEGGQIVNTTIKDADGNLTERKFTFADYKWSNGAWNSLTKYNTKETYGVVDNLNQLLADDDAVYAVDKTCRIPSVADYEELIQHTTFSIVSINSKNCGMFTAANGKFVVFPITGTVFDKISDVNSTAYYPTCEVFQALPTNYMALYFTSSGSLEVNFYTRCKGAPVRAVKSKETGGGTYDDTEIKAQIKENADNIAANKADADEKLTELGLRVDALAMGKNTINDIISEQRIENVNGAGFTFTQNVDGGILKLEKSAGKGNADGAYIYVNFALNDGVYWKAGHEYYVAVDIYVSLDSLSSNGLQYFNTMPKFSDTNSIGRYEVKHTVNVGKRGLYKTKAKVNNSISEEHLKANRLFFQLDKKYDTNSSYRAVIYQVFVVDLGVQGSDDYIDWDAIDAIVEKKGIGYVNAVDSALKSAYSDVAGTAKETEKVKTKDIELWGDSLTAQNYGRFILGADVFTHGYGGQTSTYIRDKFLSEFNEDRTQVIWVGRNNYNEVDVVIDDIRDMVSALGTDDFVIMCPPNGQWGSFGTNGEDGTGEMKGGDSYKNFLEIERRLQAEYPSNFLNIRKAIIEGWRMGNVKLLSDFVQPSIGNNVIIEVSDATFLTTYNSSDVTAFGEDFMSKIRIGLNGKYDVYKVIEKVDNTHLIVQLEEVNNISSGNVVGNVADRGETASTKYLRVMQNADYMCWLYDTTLSTFRNDGIHMTTKGVKLVADIVSRKLSSMGLLYKVKIEYINFADPLVKQLLIDNGISGDGIGVTNADALVPLNFGTIFEGNTEITSFDECVNFKSIGVMYGFDGCTSLRSIVFGEKVYKINNNAFRNCTSLQSVTGASNVTEIWNDAFNGCSALSTIDIDWNKVEQIGQRTFKGCASLPITDLKVPNALSIGNAAFESTNIEKISSLGKITSVNAACFASCSALTDVVLHEGIVSLRNSCFERCSSLKHITVPDSVTIIGSYCFQYDNNLDSVILGAGLQTIEAKAFTSCKLSTIVSKAITPPSVADSQVFAYTSIKTIYVPDASIDAYKSADIWSVYADRIKGISEKPN